MLKSKKIQSRTWGIILPCKWDNHMSIVHKAKSVAKHCYWIKHDQDRYTEPVEDVENPRKVGELKEPHIHLLFTFNSSRDLNTVRNYFSEFKQLKENSYEKIANAYGAKRYLIHADNPEKFQYQIFEVETNDRLFSNCFIEKISSADEIFKILDSFEVVDRLSCREFCLKFFPILEQMNSYQKMVIIRNLRKEWREKNIYARENGGFSC